MKNLKFLLFFLLLAGGIVNWSGCKEDDPIETCSDGIQNGDETGIDCGGTCAVCPTCTDGIQNGDETGVDCGGSCNACPTCSDGIQNGDEEGIDCGGSACAACTEGLQNSKWQSSGSNVAVLLSTYFAADSIYAQFNTDFTYLVEQYDTAGVKTEFTGTYAQAASSVTDIWTITANQSTPTAAVAEGIFKIDGNILTYEIVQTNPPAGTAPTPEGGFGSTNGGAIGNINIQTFIRIE